MALLKPKDIRKMNAKEREEKIKELQFALLKSYVEAAKGSTKQLKEIKKAIARILTIR
jgi:ribosomal protein L29